jgi:hypothetical protein
MVIGKWIHMEWACSLCNWLRSRRSMVGCYCLCFGWSCSCGWKLILFLLLILCTIVEKTYLHKFINVKTYLSAAKLYPRLTFTSMSWVTFLDLANLLQYLVQHSNSFWSMFLHTYTHALYIVRESCDCVEDHRNITYETKSNRTWWTKYNKYCTHLIILWHGFIITY